MLTSSFDPFLFPNDLPSEVDPGDYILLTQDIYRLSAPSTHVAPETTTRTAKTMPDDHDFLDLPDDDTIEVDSPLPVWPSSPVKDSIDDENDYASLPNHRSVIPGLAKIENQQHVEQNDAGLGDEGPDQDSDSASTVSSVPYDEDQEEVKPTVNTEAVSSLRQARTSSNAAVSINSMPPRTTKRKTIEVFESVVVPGPVNTADTRSRRSSHSDAVQTATDALIVAMRESRSQSQPQNREFADTPRTAFPVTFLPPINFPPALSQTPTRHNGPPSLHAFANNNVRIKSESSFSPLSPTADLEAQLKTLDSQRHTTASRLRAHNTSLDTISPRLNTTLSICSTLAQTRKNLLAQRKLLDHRIGSNREELKETKVKAERLQGRRAEVMEARDKAQYQLDALMEQRRGIRKALGRRRYEEALLATFSDHGAREIARRVGWKPAPVPADGSEEHPLDLSENDNDSDEAEDSEDDDKASWLPIAHALIDDDRSLDFEDLSGLQEGLQDVDKRVKQEQDDQASTDMNSVQIPTADADGAGLPRIKAESPDGASSTPPTDLATSSLQTSQSEDIMREPGIEDGPVRDLPIGDITLEKLQAHFKAMEQHKKEAAKMLRMLAGVQKEVKRKEAPENLGRAAKMRRLGG